MSLIPENVFVVFSAVDGMPNVAHRTEKKAQESCVAFANASGEEQVYEKFSLRRPEEVIKEMVSAVNGLNMDRVWLEKMSGSHVTIRTDALKKILDAADGLEKIC